jgi:hypothetical protein
MPQSDGGRGTPGAQRQADRCILLEDSLHLTMAGVPAQIDPEAVLEYLTALSGVECVHDLHIWAASSTENILTAHLVMATGGSDEFLHQTAEFLHHTFNIHHTTLQIERSDIERVCHTNDPEKQGRCWPGRSATSSMTCQLVRHSH